MTPLRIHSARPNSRLIVLVVVGLLGLVLTAWVARETAIGEQKLLEQRFEYAARERAELISSSFRRATDQLTFLQGYLNNVGDVEWSVFETLGASLMTSRAGLNTLAWAPVVDGPEREKFERDGRKLWGSDFSIREFDAEGYLVLSLKRDRYYPLRYILPSEEARKRAGVDLHATVNNRQLIDQAVDEGRFVVRRADGLMFSSNPGQPTLVLVIPVYRKGVMPAMREERRASVRGVLVANVDIPKLLAASDLRPSQHDLDVSIVESAEEAKIIDRRGAEKKEGGASPLGKALGYSQSFELASRLWIVRIKANPSWLDSNTSNKVSSISIAGVLLTLLLLVYLHKLLARSALVDVLEKTRQEDLKRWRVAENWANKLSLAVEQNPATIYITDLSGHIEYVNDKFVETTGYSREEVIGQDDRILLPSEATATYQDFLETISAGKTWQGEARSRHRDGTLYWEQVLVAPIKDRDGVISNYVAIKEDISKLREVVTRLQESESCFRGAMSVMAEGLVILSSEGVCVFANRAAVEIHGCVDGTVYGYTPDDSVLEKLHVDGSPCPPEDLPSSITLREGREVRDFVLRYRFADGTFRWFLINSSPLRFGEEDHFGAVLTLSDITERRRAKEQLQLAFAAIRCSGEGILVTDADQHIILVNPAFEAVTGYSAEEITGKAPAIFSSDRQDESFYAAMHEMLENTGYWQGEVWNQRKNGEAFPEWLGVSMVREHDGRPKYFVYIFSDMTERNDAQQRIEFLAHHDALTGLPNRLLLRDRVEQAQAQADRMQSRVALMFLDLDRFKTINDSLGHPMGDALLKEAVERLKGCVRESDTISRQGGDEFIVLLNDIRDGEAVSRVADKIHHRMAEPVILGEHSLITSFSIGIALYPDDGDDFDSLLQKADTAMYHAKEAGRNAHRFFTEQMNHQVVERLTLENRLRLALENKEFVLHYQPQMDLSEGKIVGVEALIRWNSPENGLVSPAKFIPVAEDSGLIVPIGAWVLGEACRQARAWQDAGLPPFVVAVNLSAVQFRRQDLLFNVINALVLSDLDSQWLELELTESILIQDAETTLDTVRRLKALGVKLSVDDFGTGYSSLAYLKRFAVDKLKIDQSFIRDLLVDPDDAAIVRAIIQMAHSLKLKTIAEGVESEELTNLLRLFHCDEIQGYGFARPMPADQLEAFLREHQERLHD